MARHHYIDPPFGWENLLDPNNSCHVIPLRDDRPHVVNMGHTCWCEPVVEDDGYVIRHNSADGREAFENTTRLLS